MTYASTVLAASPLLYWRLGESSGSAIDQSGNSRDGSWGSNVQRSPLSLLGSDPSNGSARFTGGGSLSTDSILRSDESWMDSIRGVACLVSPADLVADTNPYTIISRYHGNTSTHTLKHFRLYRHGGDNLAFVWYVNNANQTVAAVANDVFTNAEETYHIAGFIEADTVYLYVNGVQVASQALGSNTLTTVGSVSLRVGGHEGINNSKWVGWIDEMALFADGDLTEEVVEELWAEAGPVVAESRVGSARTFVLATPPSVEPRIASLGTNVLATRPQPTPGPYPAVVMAKSPLLYWRLGETAGDAFDWSGNHRHGSVGSDVGRNATGLLVGDDDGAASFPGGASVSLFTVARNDETWMNASALTISCLIKPANVSGTKWIATRRGTSGTAAWSLALVDDTLSARVYTTSGNVAATGGSGITTTDPTHVGFTWDGAEIVTYLNGVEVASEALGGTMGDSAHPLRLGALANAITDVYLGLIDEFAWFGEALTPEEMAEQAAAAISGTPTETEFDGGHYLESLTLRSGTLSRTVEGGHYVETPVFRSGSFIQGTNYHGGHFTESLTLRSGSISRVLHGGHHAEVLSLLSGTHSRVFTGGHHQESLVLRSGTKAVLKPVKPFVLTSFSLWEVAGTGSEAIVLAVGPEEENVVLSPLVPGDEVVVPLIDSVDEYVIAPLTTDEVIG